MKKKQFTCETCNKAFAGFGNRKACSLECSHVRRSATPETILSHDVDDNGCWIKGHLPRSENYRKTTHHGETISLHRYSLEYHAGPPPSPGMFACHKCHVRECFNPDHLYWGTVQDNVRDTVLAGNHSRGSRVNTASTDEKTVIEIRKKFDSHLAERRANGFTFVRRGFKTALAKEYGLTKYSLDKICSRNTWKHIP